MERNISLRLHNATLKNGLDVVAEKADFQWSYNASIIEAERRVSLLADAVSVREALVRLLGDGYEFRQNGNYLILKKLKKPEKRLSGYISDPKTGRKVPNATIYDRQTLRATTTDANGFYEIRVPERTELVVAKLDYRETVLQVTPQTPRFVKIELAADSTVRPQQACCDTATRWEPRKWQLLSRYVQHLIRKSEQMVARQELVSENVRDSFHRSVQISLLPWVSNNGMMSGAFTNNISLNALVGYSRANDGIELAGIGNVTRERMRGLQAAGVFNANHGDARGIQAAGVFNWAGDTLQGAQFAGVFNLAHAPQPGAIQAAGVFNIAERGGHFFQFSSLLNVVDSGGVIIQSSGLINAADRVTGLQHAGLVNAAGRVSGLQISGLVNAASDVSGVQAASLVNAAEKFYGVQASGLVNAAADFRGIQAAGLVNVADTMDGLQASGLVNRATLARGVQIGIINTATEIRGLQIGLLNVSKRGGYVALEASANDVLTGNLSFKTGVPIFYLNYTAGLRLASPLAELPLGASDGRLWGFGMGIGSRIPLGRHGLTLDLTQRHLAWGDHTIAVQEWSQFSPSFDLRLGRHFSLAGGPTANLYIDDPNESAFYDLPKAFRKKNLVQENSADGLRLTGWLGWSAALRLKF